MIKYNQLFTLPYKTWFAVYTYTLCITCYNLNMKCYNSAIQYTFSLTYCYNTIFNIIINMINTFMSSGETCLFCWNLLYVKEIYLTKSRSIQNPGKMNGHICGNEMFYWHQEDHHARGLKLKFQTKYWSYFCNFVNYSHIFFTVSWIMVT